MSVVASSLLAGSAVGVLLWPGQGAARLGGLVPGPAPRPAPGPAPRPAPGLATRRAPWPDALLAPRARGGLAAVAGLAAGLLGGAVAAPVAALAVLALLAAVAARQTAARDAAERRSALEACAALAAELRAGRSAAAALDAAVLVSAGPLRAVLSAGSAAARFGGDVPAALLAEPAGRASSVPELPRGLAACWQVCAGTGTGLAASVERLEEGLRAREVARRAVDAELAGPRATAALLAVLPVGGIALAAALGAQPLQTLLHTPVGGACLVVGVGLDLAGVWWTRALARRAAGSV